MLKQLFIETLQKYSTNKELILQYWLELENLYNSNKRHYHNLVHLENLYVQLKKVEHLINDWDCVLLALFYHDAIYNTLGTDNEEKSAELAKKHLANTRLSKEQIERCYQHIIATKTHAKSTDIDTNIFTDADLSILGSEWDNYKSYAKQIRKEYSIYPTLVYNKGRKKALKHLLSLEQLYKTPFFYNLYESKAIENLKNELESI